MKIRQNKEVFFYPANIIYYLARHHKHKINCLFAVDKRLAYRSSYSNHTTATHRKGFECYHCSNFYTENKIMKDIKNCSRRVSEDLILSYDLLSLFLPI